MKKSILFLMGIAIFSSIVFQAIQRIGHQPVIKNSVIELVANFTIGIKASILQGLAKGIEVYSNNHLPVSNTNGLMAHIIGRGTVLVGVFAKIDWSDGPFETNSVYATSDSSSAYGNPGSFETIGQVPTVTTLPASNITNTGATFNGKVNACSHNITVVFEYGLTTEYGSVITATQRRRPGSSEIEVTASVNDLTPGTTYFFITKALNELGISYGETESFKTTITGLTGKVSDNEDNEYNTIGIGHQEWMAENLRYLPEVIGPDKGSHNEPYYYVYNYHGTNIIEAKATDNYRIYGVLYNWSAALKACPAGWHLPTIDDWDQLINYVALQRYPNSNVRKGAGNALKSSRQFDSPKENTCDTLAHPRWDSDSIHHGHFGFSALPGGTRLTDGCFYGIGGNGNWWSASETSSVFAWYRLMDANQGNVGRYSLNKAYGFSVRCVRDN